MVGKKKNIIVKAHNDSEIACLLAFECTHIYENVTAKAIRFTKEKKGK
jgi:hypothetical protein